MAVGLAASAATRNQLVAAALSFVVFFVVLLSGALEGQVRSPEVAAVIRRASLFRLMEDFGHGIVDSRQVVMLAIVTIVALLIATALLGAPARPAARRCAARAPAAGLADADLDRGDRGHDVLPVGAALRARRLDAGVAVRPVAADGGVLRALPRPVEATIFLYADRDRRGARRRRADARDRRPSA